RALRQLDLAGLRFASESPRVWLRTPIDGTNSTEAPVPQIRRRSGTTEETPHAVLRKRQCPHPLRGGRPRLPAPGHPWRRAELAGQQLADRRDQRDGRIQERLPRYHDGPAQRQWRRVDRPGTDREYVERVRRRPARAD